MKKVLSTIVVGFVITVFSSLIGCSSSDSGPSVGGTWKEMGCSMGFSVDGQDFVEYMSVPPTGMQAFAGVIVNDPDRSAASGIFIIRVTSVGMSTDNAAVGMYTAARWKDFNGDTVGQTNAKDADYNTIYYATEAEASALTEDSPELNRFCCNTSNRI